MNSWKLIFRNLVFHRRVNFAVMLGVAAATAVLTGALFVGDSMRESLRQITLDRLGAIDEILLLPRFFREELANELADSESFVEEYSRASALILFPEASIEWPIRKTDTTHRAAGITVIGHRPDFWSFGSDEIRPNRMPTVDEILINQQLADDLGIQPADVTSEEGVSLTLRVPKAQQVPSDSPLGEKEDLVESAVGLKLIGIIPDKSLGRFGMRPTQILPRNAFVSIDLLQRILDQPDRANSLIVAGKSNETPPGESASQQLAKCLRPTLDDYGLIIKHVKQEFPSEDGKQETIYDYFSLSSDQMMFDADRDQTARAAFSRLGAQPILTYLANDLNVVKDDQETPTDQGVPFSMVASVDFTDGFNPKSAASGDPIGRLGDDEIVLHEWAADNIGAKVGDTIQLAYYEPETTHGQPVERVAEFVLKDIAALTEPASPYRGPRPAVFDELPTLANDPDLTPQVPGVTDSDSIENWDLPFETAHRIRPDDDRYWDFYRTTPKGFISLAAGQKLWNSRFGETTSYRIPATGLTAADIEDRFLTELHDANRNLGFEFVPVKRNGLLASKGTTPFDGLFLGLSFFIIISAVMLVALLFRLGIEQRASEIGTLWAVGIRRRKTGVLLVGEGALVAALGGLIGVVLGYAYAAIMIHGLRTWWVGAVVTPFLTLHGTETSLVLGYVIAILICVASIATTVYLARKQSVRSLLSGRIDQAASVRRQAPRWIPYVVVGLLIVAIGLAVSATQLGGEAQAGAFMGAGFLLLGGLLLGIWSRLRSDGSTRAVDVSRLGIARMSLRNAGRNSGRSTLTIGLVASASFLIIAISSFRLDPGIQGSGGFQYVATTTRPVFAALDTQQGLREIIGSKAADIPDSSVLSLRYKAGDDASCNNPYRSSQPRVLGVTPAMIRHFDEDSIVSFEWAGSTGETESDTKNPWHLLEQPVDEEGYLPVVIDKNTAMYSLQIYALGTRFEYTYDSGQTVKFKVVGFLANSLFQGTLLISETNFREVFPEISGYRYFLIRSDTPIDDSSDVPELIAALSDRLSDHGFAARRTDRVLAGLLAVQNTYLSTFQSLGALGLLLGTFGLATVQLRNILERRQELALLRAIGFRRETLTRLVVYENMVLLFGGLAVGTTAAMFAVIPHMVFGKASVPLGELLLMLAVIALIGLITGILAIRSTLRAPLLPALRKE